MKIKLFLAVVGIAGSVLMLSGNAEATCKNKNCKILQTPVKQLPLNRNVNINSQ